MKILDDIKARINATTPGQWRYVNEIDPNPIFLKTWGPDYKTMHFVQCGGENDTPTSSTLRNITPKQTMMTEGDAKFCAHAHQDVPLLVKALERLIAEIDRSTDSGFQAHCKRKVESILNGEEE